MLKAIKERDRARMKGKVRNRFENLYGILQATGQVASKKRRKQSIFEIFHDTQVHGFNMYEQMSEAEAAKYRYQKQILERHLSKLNIILQMGTLQGTFYTRLCLKKIELVKQLFVLEIEQDQEVFIPPELS